VTFVPSMSVSVSSLRKNSCTHGKEHCAFLAKLYLVSEPSGLTRRTLIIRSQSVPRVFSWFTCLDVGA